MQIMSLKLTYEGQIIIWRLKDAKIFAVATLMSSYLIYNSVKIIDQSSIEYLELLARRTQLFGIKTELAANSSVYSQLLQFPPLLWVIEGIYCSRLFLTL
jgi:hypothetical protein